jgi:predicted MPP superfamily phosphohydrolase
MHERNLLTRRQALQQLSAGALLSLGLWPGALRARENGSGNSFRFIAINDLHYMSPECGDWLTRVLRQIKTHDRVELLLIAGDLAEYGRRSDFAAVRELLEESDIPAFVVPGNHDYLGEKLPTPEPRDERASSRTPAGKYDRRAYDEFFPHRLNYYFKHRGWQIVALDTTEGLLYEKTSIQPDTFTWLDKYLPRLDKNAPTVVFTHFPLGPDVRYRPQGSEAALERFKPYNLQAVFSGHWHGFSERKLGPITLTTNRCCALKRGNHDGSKEKGYFLCQAEAGRVTRTFIEVKPQSSAA